MTETDATAKMPSASPGMTVPPAWPTAATLCRNPCQLSVMSATAFRNPAFTRCQTASSAGPTARPLAMMPLKVSRRAS